MKCTSACFVTVQFYLPLVGYIVIGVRITINKIIMVTILTIIIVILSILYDHRYIHASKANVLFVNRLLDGAE